MNYAPRQYLIDSTRLMWATAYVFGHSITLDARAERHAFAQYIHDLDLHLPGSIAADADLNMLALIGERSVSRFDDYWCPSRCTSCQDCISAEEKGSYLLSITMVGPRPPVISFIAAVRSATPAVLSP